LDYLDLAQVAVVVLDARGRVERINRKGCEILGRDRDDIVGKNWFESFVPARLRERLAEVHGRLMAGESVAVETFENPILDGAGEERLIAWHNTVLQDDSGRIVNPLLAHGQVVGATAQGLGQALLEEVRHDESGQSLSVSFVDYPLLTAWEMPELASDFVETPTPLNELGAKGVGEGGSIATPPAVANAVVDALDGVQLDPPFTAEKLWEALR